MVAALVLLLVLSTNASAMLVARDLDGDQFTAEAWYDTALNITWLADANLASTQDFGIGGVQSGGTMTWSTAQLWVAAANANSLFSLSNWRLPSVIDFGNDGCNFGFSSSDCGHNVDPTSGEYAALFFDTLGNTSILDDSGVLDPSGGLASNGPFINFGPFDFVPDGAYWTQTLDAADPDNTWFFNFDIGVQNVLATGNPLTEFALKTWLVHDGDVGAVVIPIPAAGWLLLACLPFLRARRF